MMLQFFYPNEKGMEKILTKRKLNEQDRVSYAKLLVNDVELPYQIRFSKKAKYLQLRINHSNSLELVIPKRYSLKMARNS